MLVGNWRYKSVCSGCELTPDYIWKPPALSMVSAVELADRNKIPTGFVQILANMAMLTYLRTIEKQSVSARRDIVLAFRIFDVAPAKVSRFMLCRSTKMK